MIQPRFYIPLLQLDEKVLLVTDRHWTKRLLAHYALCIGTILTSLGLYMWLSDNDWWNLFATILLGLWTSSIIVTYFLAWSFILERRGLVLTTHRLLHFHHDALTRSHFVIPYKGIEESDIKETVISRLFGYGDWHLVVHENKERISFKGYNKIRDIEHIINRYMTPGTSEQ